MLPAVITRYEKRIKAIRNREEALASIERGSDEFRLRQINLRIDQGEDLIALRRDLKADGLTVNEIRRVMDETVGLAKAHRVNLERIAVHKVQCRYLAAVEGITGYHALKKIIPKASEPPVEVPALPDKLGYVGSQPGEKKRDTNDWHTPVEYIERARTAMGSIDLDPFSSVAANQRVKAERFFTEADNAIHQSWDTAGGCVWMNPPYGKKTKDNPAAADATDSVAKYIEEWRLGSFSQGIVLMNNATDTDWFQLLVRDCTAMCFTKGRIKFEDDGGKAKAGNTRGQVFVYHGDNPDAFFDAFADVGTCWQPQQRSVG